MMKKGRLGLSGKIELGLGGAQQASCLAQVKLKGVPNERGGQKERFVWPKQGQANRSFRPQN